MGNRISQFSPAMEQFRQRRLAGESSQEIMANLQSGFPADEQGMSVVPPNERIDFGLDEQPVDDNVGLDDGASFGEEPLPQERPLPVALPQEIPAEPNIVDPRDLEAPEGFGMPGQARLDQLESPESRELARRQGQLGVDQAAAGQADSAEVAKFDRDAYKALEATMAESDEKIQVEIDTMKGEYDKYKNMKVQDFWADKPTWSKILSALSVGLGAYAQGMGAGRNTALAILNKTMDDDYRKQRSQIDKQFQTYKISKGNVDQVRSLYNRKIRQLDIKRVAGLRALKSTVQSKKVGLKTEAAQIQAEVIENNLDTKIAMAQDNVTSKLNAMIARERRRKDMVANTARKERAKLLAKTEKIKESRAGSEIGDYAPQKGVTLRPADASKLREMKALKDDTTHLVKQLKTLTEKYGSFETGGIGGVEMETLTNRIHMNMKDFDNLGVLAGPDMGLLLGQIPKPGDIGSLFTRDKSRQKQYDVFLNSLDSKLDSRMKAFGLRKVPQAEREQQQQKKKITKKMYSQSRDKTRIIYSDGTEEIVNGFRK